MYNHHAGSGIQQLLPNTSVAVGFLDTQLVNDPGILITLLSCDKANSPLVIEGD